MLIGVADDRGVVVGTTSDETAPPRRPAVGRLVVGLLLGLLVVTADSALRRFPPTPGEATTTSTPTNIAIDLGIGDLVPGLDGGLVAVIGRQVGTEELMVWPKAGTPFMRAAPDSITEVSFDVAGNWVAGLVPVPFEATSTLYAGALAQLFPAAPRVSSFAWHQSEPAELAYVLEGPVRKLLRGLAFGPWLEVGTIAQGEHLVAYGDWGLMVSDEFVHILDRNGSPVGDSADQVAVSPRGDLLSRLGDRVRIGEVGKEPTDAPWAPISWLDAQWSPSGDRIAFLLDVGDGRSRVEVWSATGEQLAAVDSPSGLNLDWTADSGHLLTWDAALRQVWFLASEAQEPTTVSLPAHIIGVDVRLISDGGQPSDRVGSAPGLPSLAWPP